MTNEDLEELSDFVVVGGKAARCVQAFLGRQALYQPRQARASPAEGEEGGTETNWFSLLCNTNNHVMGVWGFCGLMK